MEQINLQTNNITNTVIKNNFIPTVYGVGITDNENTRDINGRPLASYTCWRHMLGRCYNVNVQKKNPTYIGCTVCDEWLHYSNFKKFYDENYYKINGKSSQIDKDFLIKGNKVYSPDTCIFVPPMINSLITKSNKTRGDLPIGVDFHRFSGKYRASCSVYKNGKVSEKHLGLYNSPQEAFNSYKKFKEQYIKQIANEFKDIIPKKLYDVMYRYQVKITD